MRAKRAKTRRRSPGMPLVSTKAGLPIGRVLQPCGYSGTRAGPQPMRRSHALAAGVQTRTLLNQCGAIQRECASRVTYEFRSNR
jgi:hypothetical protein